MYMKHVHIGLDEELFRELESAAEEESTSKSQLIRTAVAEFLRRRSERTKAAAMRRYAESMAPHSAEFVEASGATVLSQLLRETEW